MDERRKDQREEMPDIPQDIKNAFQKTLKQGIYKELHHRNLLSAEQLNALLKTT